MWGFWAFVICVNLLVSSLGNTRVFVLSPFHLWNKTQALGYYAAHRLNRLVDGEMISPHLALRHSARKHNVPKRLAFAIAKAESDFIPDRISRCGAMGTMQLMPGTARELGLTDPFHPEQNVDGGVRYLARLMRRYRGDFRRVAAAYNAGPNRVPRSGAYRVPAETRRYVDTVLRYTRRFQR